MIKGWRNNPDWVSLVEQRIANREQCRMLDKAQQFQSEINERHKLEIAKQEKHRLECHAEHERNGTLTPKPKGH